MAIGCDCARDALCDGCVDDAFAQLRGVAACRGEVWAADIARRAPGLPWPQNSEKARAIAMVKVADLTRDPRLRERLAIEIERWAERRCGEIRAELVRELSVERL